MKTFYLLCVCAISIFFFSTSAMAFDSHGQVTSEIDYSDLEIHPPETGCDGAVVKGDPNGTKCLPKVNVRLTYAFTKDRALKATLVFYTIFNEIIGEAKINETLRWEEDHVDVVDFIYVYPEFDFDAVINSHHIEWEIRTKR